MKSEETKTPTTDGAESTFNADSTTTTTATQQGISLSERIKQANDFLQYLYHNLPITDENFSYLWLQNEKTKITVPFKINGEYDNIAQKAVDYNENGYNVFVGVNITNKPMSEHERPKAEEITIKTAIIADIDVENGLWHVGDKYPPNIETAESLLPFKPSVLVDSGAGIHAYNLIDEPIVLNNQDERDQAVSINKNYIEKIRNKADKFARAVDGVHDLPRVLRLPGTYNLKCGRTNAPLCKVIKITPFAELSQSDLRELLNHKESSKHKNSATTHLKTQNEPLCDDIKYDDFRAERMIDCIEVAELTDTEWLAFMSACKNCGVSYSVVDEKNLEDRERYNEIKNQKRWDSLSDPKYNIETLHGIAKKFRYSERDSQREWYKLHPELQNNSCKNFEQNNSAGGMPDFSEMFSTQEFDEVDISALFDLPHTDLYNARRLAMFYGKEIRFLTDVCRWYTYKNNVWTDGGKDNSAILPFCANLADTICDNTNRANDTETAEKLAKKWQSRKTHSNSIELLKGIDAIRITEKDLNTHKNLLNCKNGVVDLQTGELYQGDQRLLLITQQVNAVYDPNARSETVEKFLNDVLPDNETLQALLRYLGYCLTGEISEEKSLFIHGTGGNGKGTLSTVLSKLFGDYSCAFPVEAILLSPYSRKDGDGATPALNLLQWRRLAVAEEIPARRKLDYALFKILTGGDALPIRKLYQESTQISTPTHKFIFSGNHLPELDDTHDPGILRRWLQLHFEQDFTNNPDSTLKSRLLTDDSLNAMLNLLVTDAIAWYENGLIISDKMTTDREQYFSENDFITEFITEYCERGENLSVSRKALLDTLKAEYPTQTHGTTDQALTTTINRIEGIIYRRGTGGGYHFFGIQLRHSQNN